MIRSVGFFVKNFTKTLVATIITRQAVRKRMELLEISGGSLGGLTGSRESLDEPTGTS